MTALVWFGIGFAVCRFLCARVRNRTERDAPAPPPHTRTRTSTGRYAPSWAP